MKENLMYAVVNGNTGAHMYYFVSRLLACVNARALENSRRDKGEWYLVEARHEGKF